MGHIVPHGAAPYVLVAGRVPVPSRELHDVASGRAGRKHSADSRPAGKADPEDRDLQFGERFGSVDNSSLDTAKPMRAPFETARGGSGCRARQSSKRCLPISTNEMMGQPLYVRTSSWR